MSKLKQMQQVAATVVAKKADGEDEKPPSIHLDGEITDTHLIIRVPLELNADDLRMTDPAKKGKRRGVPQPFGACLVKLPQSAVFTAIDGEDSMSLYSRTAITFNLFFGYTPSAAQSNDDED